VGLIGKTGGKAESENPLGNSIIHGALEGRSEKKQSEHEPLFTHKWRRGSCFSKGIV